MDWTTVTDPGARFENMIACHLLKWCYYKQDTEGIELELRYFRDVDKREVDFVVLENNAPVQFIECNVSDKKVALALKYMKKRFPHVMATQVLLENDRDFVTKEGIRVCSADRLLNDVI